MNDEVTEFSCKEECVNDEQEHATVICHIEPDCNAEGADQPIKLEPEQVLVVPIDAPDESEPSFHINNGACDEEAYGGMLETRRKQDEERLAEKLKRGTRGFALGSVSDKIVPWLRARFERKEGGKTAIQEVIKLYAFDFPRDSIYFPLESFQVGQLVRQAFPNIELCKVTNADRKRLRCYKNLYRRDVTHGPAPIFPLNQPKQRIVKQPTTTTTVTTPVEQQLTAEQMTKKPSQMNSAAAVNFTTYRSKRLEQKLNEIAAQKVLPGVGTKRGPNSTTNGSPAKVLVISQPVMIKVPKATTTTKTKLVAASIPENMVQMRSRVSPSSMVKKKKQTVVGGETTSLTKNESSSHLVPVNSSSPPPPSPPVSSSSSSTTLQQKRHRGQDLTPEQQSLLADLIPKRTIKETAKFDQIRHQLNQVLDVVELSQLTPDQLNQLIHIAKTRFSMMAK